MVPATIVLVILAATIALFVSDRLPLDLVALLSLLALLLSGVLTPNEGMAGFSNAVVPMLAGLFTVGAALQQTGVTRWVGAQLGRLSQWGETRLSGALMAMSATLSSFMSSTGTVAILMPIVVAVGRRAFIPPRRLLMPLAFASLFGGTLTLIGTPPNIVVNDELRRHGTATFGFFSYTGPGLVLLVVGMLYMATIGRRLLGRGDTDAAGAPSRTVTQRDLAQSYGVSTQLAKSRILPNSPLIGQTLREVDFRRRYGMTLLGLTRSEERGGRAKRIVPDLRFRAGDTLSLQSGRGEFDEMIAAEGLERIALGERFVAADETLAELVVPRRSRYVDRSLREIQFRTRYRTTVLGILRDGSALNDPSVEYRLQPGDSLLVKGPVKNIRLLARAPKDLVVIGETEADQVVDPKLAPRSVGITALMLLAMVLQLVPNVVAVMAAAVAMVLAGCLTTVEAYRRINWESIIVIAAILPMSTALQKTGLVDQAVSHLVDATAGLGPRGIVALLFLVTNLASLVMSNTATTVLVAPVAYQVAEQLGLAPQPFLMTVALAASSALATPVASPVNMLVLNPGGYRFRDFVVVGLPLQLLLWGAAVAVVPWFFPF
ncbi:MAG: SLC13 family permease [Myxococcota bacterium]